MKNKILHRAARFCALNSDWRIRKIPMESPDQLDPQSSMLARLVFDIVRARHRVLGEAWAEAEAFILSGDLAAMDIKFHSNTDPNSVLNPIAMSISIRSTYNVWHFNHDRVLHFNSFDAFKLYKLFKKLDIEFSHA